MEKYKITLLNQFNHLWITLVVCTLIFFYPEISFAIGIEEVLVDRTFSLVIVLISITPIFMLHVCYFIINKGLILKYYSKSKSIQLISKKETISFDLDQIKTIQIFKTYDLAENRTLWMLWSPYHYHIITLNSGQSFYLTSLLTPNLTLPVDESRTQLNKTFMAFPWSFFKK